jgi:hypothetical protein
MKLQFVQGLFWLLLAVQPYLCFPDAVRTTSCHQREDVITKALKAKVRREAPPEY